MDARSLLRAKKAEARIVHPYAAYSAAGQLRCSVCAIPVQQWEAHLLTKQHRTSTARERATQAEQIARSTAKRPAASVEEIGSSTKRARVEAEEEEEGEDEDEEDGNPKLPAGFFSDPSAGPSKPTRHVSFADTETPASGPAQAAAEDPELDDFFASLADTDVEEVSDPVANGSRAVGGMDDDDLRGMASYEAAPVRNIVGQEEEAESEPEEAETEQERRERLSREEKEEIMDRLAEEERAQEDADSRVVALKARMELLRKRREGKGTKAAGAASGKAKLPTAAFKINGHSGT